MHTFFFNRMKETDLDCNILRLHPVNKHRKVGKTQVLTKWESDVHVHLIHGLCVEATNP